MTGIGTSGSASFGVDWYATRAGQHEEEQDRYCEARVADCELDDIHDYCVPAARAAYQLLDRLRVGFNGLDHVAFRHQFLAGDDDAGIGRDAAEHQPVGGVVDQIDRDRTQPCCPCRPQRMPRSPAALSDTTERGRITASTGADRSVISAVMPAGNVLSSLGIATSMRKVRVDGDASRLM